MFISPPKKVISKKVMFLVERNGDIYKVDLNCETLMHTLHAALGTLNRKK